MSRGSIRRRGESSWEIRLWVPDENGARQRSWTVHGSKSDAERELSVRVMQLLDGRLRGDERRVVLSTHVDDWLAVQERRVSAKTVSSYRGLLEKHVVPMLGGYRVAEITTRQIDGLYQRKLEEGLSPRTVRYIHVVLRRCLADAVKWGAAQVNPADNATPPRASKAKVQAWSAEDARRFLHLLEEHPHPVGDVWRLCLMLGLRRGEALALAWEDVDLEAGTVLVRRSYGRDGKLGLRFKEPKTASSRRLVAVDEVTLRWLSKKRQDGFGGVLVAGTEAGDPFDPDVASKTFAAYCVGHGLPRIRLHDLRHTQASLALAAGVPLKVVSERLGHAGVQITADTYTHVSDVLHRDSAGKVAGLLYQTGQPGTPDN